MSRTLNEKILKNTTMVALSVSEINRIIDLLDRNDAKAVVETTSYSGDSTYHKCPVCGEVLCKRSKFCDMCGQRLDRELIAL